MTKYNPIQPDSNFFDGINVDLVLNEDRTGM